MVCNFDTFRNFLSDKPSALLPPRKQQFTATPAETQVGADSALGALMREKFKVQRCFRKKELQAVPLHPLELIPAAFAAVQAAAGLPSPAASCTLARSSTVTGLLSVITRCLQQTFFAWHSITILAAHRPVPNIALWPLRPEQPRHLGLRKGQ